MRDGCTCGGPRFWHRPSCPFWDAQPDYPYGPVDGAPTRRDALLKWAAGGRPAEVPEQQWLQVQLAMAEFHRVVADEYRKAAAAERDAAVKWKRSARWATWFNVGSAVFCLILGLWNVWIRFG